VLTAADPDTTARSKIARIPSLFYLHISHRLPPLLQVFLVYGKTGWIGGLVGEILKQQGANWEYGTARLESRDAILADIERVSLILHASRYFMVLLTY
jgi:hypothetical protein